MKNLLTRIFNGSLYGLSFAHFWTGLALTLNALVFSVSPYANLIYTLALGIAHELGDGDLTTGPKAPFEGFKDVLVFLPVPILYILLYN
jgi:hypothetical protein